MIDHRMKIYHFSKKILSIHVFFVFFHQTSYIFQSIISPQIYQFINFPFIPRLSSKFRDWIDYEDRFEMKRISKSVPRERRKTLSIHSLASPFHAANFSLVTPSAVVCLATKPISNATIDRPIDRATLPKLSTWTACHGLQATGPTWSPHVSRGIGPQPPAFIFVHLLRGAEYPMDGPRASHPTKGAKKRYSPREDFVPNRDSYARDLLRDW